MTISLSPKQRQSVCAGVDYRCDRVGHSVLIIPDSPREAAGMSAFALVEGKTRLGIRDLADLLQLVRGASFHLSGVRFEDCFCYRCALNSFDRCMVVERKCFDL